MRETGFRRVVTGLDGEGRSCVAIDGPIPRLGPMSAALAWRTDAVPVDNSGTADTAVPYAVDLLHTGGSNFAVCEFPPGARAFMHATDTIDYLVVLSGRVTLVLETGEAALGPGDFVVDRGVMHGWRNDHDEPCTCAVVNLPAHPIGKGRTI
ncbi:cupin domain-containing protein [Novosphingobium album (ex Liu et al. 2023)]|uniref:Cupin domain-containing protein n=1 Tax=Novosphingobium album (ex Liu et al. 2023) TaxID=3031130 RepID=A0ABT5WXE3_9SPHN|nr:cupin domain-containing protein [Novosphingobium album (ex Liu et al. 2023)]MDE8654573.1 cupin domain-containing protein [Novosphingobium album (ex Liu et al. 2023)]